MSQFNLRSPAVKRLMKEAQELKEPTEEYFAQPLEDNLFEWHFTVKGPTDSDFSDGYYHGRIILPTEYPMKPPSIIILTPNGRFETNKKICLSISGHHPESWQPSWSIRTALLAIIGFMPTETLGAIGSLDYSSEERKTLALKSQSWVCPTCGLVKNLLKEKSANASPQPESEENKMDKELAKQICFKGGESSPSESKPSAVSKSSLESNSETVDAVASEPPSPQIPQENGLRQRHTTPVNLQHSPGRHRSQTSEVVTAVPSRTRKSTYCIIVLTAAIGFLIFRRLFLIA